MTYRIFGTAMAVSLLAVQAAWADCTPDNAPNGSIVTCTGSDTDGFDFEDRDEIDITVEAGATVSNGSEGIRTDDDLTAKIHGSVTSTGNNGLQADKRADVTVYEGGSITSTSSAEDDHAVDLGDDGEVDNAGLISTDYNDGIHGDADLTVTNSGTIYGGDEGIQAGDGLDVTNDGTIEGADEGIKGENGTKITNNATGQIIAGDHGIDTEGFDDLDVTNDGLIQSGGKGIRAGADDDGLGGTGLVVVNNGTIDSVDEGIEAGDGADITNNGRIESDEDDGIQLGAGVVLNSATGVIYTEGGDGIDIDSGLITNHGWIETTMSGEAGIDVDEGTTEDVTIVNTGTIKGSYGVLSDPANTQGTIITNSGTIEGFDGYAMDLGQGSDWLKLLDGSTIVGASDFGTGDDQLDFLGTDYDLSDAGLFDGGEGTDLVTFSIGFDDISALLLEGENLFSLTFGDTTVLLANWETFQFSDRSFTAAELGAIAAVPLPAGFVLLGSGLLGLGALRRRRRAA